MMHFLTVFYQALCEPKTLYQSVVSEWPKQQLHVLYAVAIVLIISMTKTLVLATNTKITGFTIAWILLSGIVGLLVWLLLCVTYACMAFSLRSKARLFTLMTLTAYAAVPWFLILPLQTVLTHIPYIGTLLYLLAIFCIVGWVFTLLVFALQETYQLKPSQAVMMCLTPVMLLLLLQAWAVDGIVGLFSLISSM